MAGIPRMDRKRHTVGPGPGDRDVVIDGIHLAFHRLERVKPGSIAGFLPGQALHGADDGQRGEFRQDIGAGEQLLPPGVLAQDRILERMHDEHPLAGERRAPGAGVVVGFERAQLGKQRALAAGDDLPLGPDIPECKQVDLLHAVCVERAEAVQRFVVGREYAGQIADIGPHRVAVGLAAGASVFGDRAHLGGAAAAHAEDAPFTQPAANEVVAGFGRKDRHAAVFPAEQPAFDDVAGNFLPFGVVIHRVFPLSFAAWPARFRRCCARGISNGCGPWRHPPSQGLRPLCARP